MSQADRSKLRMMVVDDEPDNLDLLYRTFRRDFQVFKADSGLAALQILDQEGEMAIIISDQRMPGMNGTEFLSKTVDRFPDTIRIVLTGYTDVEDLVEAINSGKVFKYITKPWQPDELKGVVQQSGETYKVIKQRTNELRRSLRRELLFNAVTGAIRESLDYRSMLQTVVETVGRTFGASGCILRPVEDNRLTQDCFSYQLTPETETAVEPPPLPIEDNLIQSVLSSRTTQLAQSAEKGNKYVKLAVPLTYQQELLAILFVYQYDSARPLSPEDIQLIEGVAEQAALAISQAKLYQRSQQQAEQMRQDLAVACQIQSNLLPPNFLQLENFKVQAECKPAREVGGDFYEIFVHPEGDLWLAIGDVSGKGVPAALFMASAISVMRRELSQENPPEPSLVMRSLNSILSEHLMTNNCFITMVLARYNPTTRKLLYANAGHIYPIVWSQDAVLASHNNPDATLEIEPNYLKVRGIPVGILPIWKAQSGSIDLNPGDVFLLTSDGITEATVPDQDGQSASAMLQQTGLWNFLIQEKSSLDLPSLLARIQAHVKVQEDDQTMLSLEVL